ncbi:MAG TPA: DNA polymerase [Pyrinomonadaceae bacterium]|nr:DNA polymerase [Pyrinomonadaceae bacterium]
MDDTTPQYTPLDIETGNAEDLYRLPPDPSYIRLLGLGDEARRRCEPACWVIPSQHPCVTVNGHLFDFPALDRHAGIPVEQTIPFSRDLRYAAFQHDPPTSYQTKSGPGFKPYSMAALTQRYLGEDTKSDAGKELAKEYGGWDKIDPSDPRYAEYLRSDLDNTRRLNGAIPYDPYEQREAWVATITARATLNGFRVDTAGLTARAASLAKRGVDGRQMLAERFGFPLTNEAGKPAAAPQRTKAGKRALETALTSFGFPLDRWPRGVDGSLSLSKETMAFARDHAEREHPAALPVIEAVQDMNGIRNSAANLLSHVTDGRAYYTFEPFQATGRWSNGLSVLKKGSEDSERAFLLPEPGHVLVSIDLDQIDIRAAAAHAQDPALIALLNDPDRDIHTEISTLSGVERKLAKTLDLGWLYGRTVNGLAQTPGMTREAAERVSGFMDTSYPGVRRWQREVRERGEAGLLLGNGFGRNLRVEPDRAFTQAPGAVGQSTTRDLVAEGLLDLARRAPEMLPMLRMIVHDEVVASVPVKDAVECARILQSCMSRMWAPAGASIPVAITAGQGKPFTFGDNWNALYA